MHYGFIIDNRKCIGCHACTVACKAEHDIPIGVNRTWVKYIEKGTYPNTRRVFSVMRCNHCSDAPCVDICPTGALFTRSDGIVDFDRRRCIGCKACMQACPYDALYIDPETDTAAKCNYCAHRIDQNLEPACVNVCPTHAIISGDMDNPGSEISVLLAREQVTARKIEKATTPNLFYINGDHVSLEAAETMPASDYMWSSQIAGVGHFARFAEKRMAGSDPDDLLRQLQGPDKPAVDPAVPSAAADEGASRVYDAPGKGVLWDWKVSGYIWTKAIAAGTYLLVFLAALMQAPFLDAAAQWSAWAAALFFLLATGVLLILDLDRPWRFAYVLLRPQWNSWLVRGGYAITLYGGFLGLWGLAMWRDWTVLAAAAQWGGAFFAVITAVYTAFLFGQAKGRDFWQSPSLGIHMIVHAALAGAAFLSLLLYVQGSLPAWHAFLSGVLRAGIAANLLVLLFDLLMEPGSKDIRMTHDMIFTGRFAPVFWLAGLLLGNILPLVLLLWTGAALPLAAALILTGILVIEHLWIKAPQLVPLS